MRILRVAGTVLAVYLVVRGVAEFVVIDFGDPATYRRDWGGPSLMGVLAVHCGPAALIPGYLGYRIARSRTQRSAKLGAR